MTEDSSPIHRPIYSKLGIDSDKLAICILADLPSPLRRMENLEKDFDVASITVKDDSHISPIYAGNKVRKLEFLLADALKKSKKKIVTFGYAGSNHATATAVHARTLGMESISVLLPQHNADYLRNNLLCSAHFDADLKYFDARWKLNWRVPLLLFKNLLSHRQFPYWIPPGGSNAIGILGFVNAAIELKEQIDQKLLDPPDIIYVASGSFGTAIGLSLGFQAVELPTQVMAIRVIDSSYVNEERFYDLYNRTTKLMKSKSSNLPPLDADKANIMIRHEFYGQGYALPTKESEHARKLLKDLENLTLDPTYSSKAMSALLHDANSGKLKGKNVLFWNTCNGVNLHQYTSNMDWHDLPNTLHSYFSEGHQEEN